MVRASFSAFRRSAFDTLREWLTCMGLRAAPVVRLWCSAVGMLLRLSSACSSASTQTKVLPVFLDFMVAMRASLWWLQRARPVHCQQTWGAAMNFELECELEDDGRWLAEVPQLPGVLAYGASAAEAMAKAEILALRVLADRLEHGEAQPLEIRFSLPSAA